MLNQTDGHEGVLGQILLILMPC